MKHKDLGFKKYVRVTPFRAHFFKAHSRKRVFQQAQTDSLGILTRQ